VKIALDGFGDRSVGKFGHVVVFDGIYQRLDCLALFVFGHLIPLLLLPESFPDVFFSEAERRDGSPSILLNTLLTIFSIAALSRGEELLSADIGLYPFSRNRTQRPSLSGCADRAGKSRQANTEQLMWPERRPLPVALFCQLLLSLGRSLLSAPFLRFQCCYRSDIPTLGLYFLGNFVKVWLHSGLQFLLPLANRICGR
jgi:hypothetical protein